MTEEIKYTCSCCGQEHFEWPALAFTSPDNYDQLSPGDKEQIAEIDSDFCVIRHSDQIDRFIRCTLTQKVPDYCEDLEYGLWVSLSDKSYNNYYENFDNENHETTYFGWLCNEIPGYDFNESIPTTVITRTGNQRPEIVPHKDFDHPFVRDYYNGISKKVAEGRIKAMLDKTKMREERKNNKKPWWKLWSFLFIAIIFGVTCRCQTLTTTKHKAFIPVGYTELDSAFGNLNKDAYPDLLLILRDDAENVVADVARPVIVLAGNANGTFKLLGRADNAVLCAGCGGVFGDPYQGITIRNGFFSIEHYGGSAWRWTRIITFKYDRSTSMFKLHRDAAVSFHLSDPNKQTTQVHQKKAYGKLALDKYTYKEFD